MVCRRCSLVVVVVVCFFRRFSRTRCRRCDKIANQCGTNMIVRGMTFEIHGGYRPHEGTAYQRSPRIQYLQRSFVGTIDIPTTNATKQNGGMLTFDVPPNESTRDLDLDIVINVGMAQHLSHEFGSGFGRNGILFVGIHANHGNHRACLSPLLHSRVWEMKTINSDTLARWGRQLAGQKLYHSGIHYHLGILYWHLSIEVPLKRL